jgi:hypothetical protein
MKKIFKIIGILLLLSFSVCTNAQANSITQPLLLQNGFGSSNDFVFTTVAGSTSTCELNGADNPLTIYLCLNPPSNDCLTIDHITSEPNNGNFTLSAGNTYHLSALNVRQTSNGHNTLYGSYPNRIQMSRIFCSNVGRSATISSFGIYEASCNNSGCVNTSGPITVTFP